MGQDDTKSKYGLRVGMRVSISWMHYPPPASKACDLLPWTPRSADLDISPQLATVTEVLTEDVMVEGSDGGRYKISRTTLEEYETDRLKGRWRLTQPIPTYEVGESLVLSWRTRNRSKPEKGSPEARPDCIGTVVAHIDGQHYSVRVHGKVLRFCRHAGQTGRGRQQYRWRVWRRPDLIGTQ